MITTAEFGGVQSAQLIDVANFQGAFDWAAARRQVPQLAGGICKLTEGLTFTDADAAHNWAGIKDQGIVRGGYHFGHPGEDATAQAQRFVAEAGRLGLTDADMLALDLEVSDGRSPQQVADWAQTFMRVTETERPHNPLLVYTMVSFATGGESAGLGKYPLWLARPGSVAPVAPPPWAKWTFWQWGTRNGDDADAFNGTAAQLHDWVEGFAPVPAKPPAGGTTGTGPYRHATTQPMTLAELAASRNTTPTHLVEMSGDNYTAGDWAHLAKLNLPVGTRYYTSNP
jgi:lysozyme